MTNRLLILIITVFFCIQTALGQTKIDKFSFNPKFGFYNWASNDGGLLGGAEINITHKGLLYSIDYYYYEESEIVFGDSPNEYYNQIGSMIGKYYGEKLFRIQLQGGIAPIWGVRRTDIVNQGGLFSGDTYDSEKFFTAGLALKIGLKFYPLDFLGIGFDFQANINAKNPVYMQMISIEIGKLRNKINEP